MIKSGQGMSFTWKWIHESFQNPAVLDSALFSLPCWNVLTSNVTNKRAPESPAPDFAHSFSARLIVEWSSNLSRTYQKPMLAENHEKLLLRRLR